MGIKPVFSTTDGMCSANLEIGFAIVNKIKLIQRLLFYFFYYSAKKENTFSICNGFLSLAAKTYW